MCKVSGLLTVLSADFKTFPGESLTSLSNPSSLGIWWLLLTLYSAACLALVFILGSEPQND